MMKIAVFGVAGNDLDQTVYDEARLFGRLLGERGHELVFGGGQWGVMGAAASGAHEAGARVTGVIPEKLRDSEGVFERCDEVIVTRDLRDRMERMAALSDGFCVMPGGFGTLYELAEVISLNNIGYCKKPVAIANILGYYDRLNDFFEEMFRRGGAKERCRASYMFASDAAGAMRLLEKACGEEK